MGLSACLGLSTLCVISHLILTTAFWRKYYYFLSRSKMSTGELRWVKRYDWGQAANRWQSQSVIYIVQLGLVKLIGEDCIFIGQQLWYRHLWVRFRVPNFFCKRILSPSLIFLPTTQTLSGRSVPPSSTMQIILRPPSEPRKLHAPTTTLEFVSHLHESTVGGINGRARIWLEWSKGIKERKWR